MKIRVNFVSNSSSSSCIIKKSMISAVQADQIRNHIEVAKGIEGLGAYADGYNAWTIHETDDMINAGTFMDNFSMYKFLEAIGVPDEAVVWHDHDDWYSDDMSDEEFEEAEEENFVPNPAILSSLLKMFDELPEKTKAEIRKELKEKENEDS